MASMITKTILPLISILTIAILFVSAGISLYSISTATSSPTSAPLPLPNSSYLADIFHKIGLEELSSAAANLSIFPPATIFAPSAASLRTCPSCSIPLLLQQYSIPDLLFAVNFVYLNNGTKIGSFAINRCLTLVRDFSVLAEVRINGFEVMFRELYYDGEIVIIPVEGQLYHPSERSCLSDNGERPGFFPLEAPEPTSGRFIMRLRLRYAVWRLKENGYSIVASAIDENKLSVLGSMTIFVVDDESLRAAARVWRWANHLVPNLALTAKVLVSLRRDTELPIARPFRELVVTTAGNGGPSSPLRINYVKVKRFNMVNYDNKVVIHGLSAPFLPRAYPGFELWGG